MVPRGGLEPPRPFRGCGFKSYFQAFARPRIRLQSQANQQNNYSYSIFCIAANRSAMHFSPVPTAIGTAIEPAINYFQQAIDKDPHSARAYAGLADGQVIWEIRCLPICRNIPAFAATQNCPTRPPRLESAARYSSFGGRGCSPLLLHRIAPHSALRLPQDSLSLRRYNECWKAQAIVAPLDRDILHACFLLQNPQRGKVVFNLLESRKHAFAIVCDGICNLIWPGQ